MKTGIKSLLATLLCFGSLTCARATLLAQWDFTGGSLNGTPNSTYISGTPSLTTTPSSGVTASAVSGALVYSWTGNGSKLNGTQMVITLTAANTVTISGLSATADVAFSGFTGLSGSWSYSINGTGTSGATGSVTAGTGSSLGAIPSFTLQAGQTVTLTYNLTGSGTGTGNPTLSFDVLQISGNFSPVPEPTSYAMAAFGLIFIGGGAGRYYFVRRKALADR